jgi:hypothetical protein
MVLPVLQFSYGERPMRDGRRVGYEKVARFGLFPRAFP